MSSEPGPLKPETTPSWELLDGRSPSVGALLRLDQRAVPVRDIRGFVATTDLGEKKRPAIIVMGVFAVIGMMFLFGVIDIGTRARFVVAAILFGSISLVAVNDMLRLATSGVFRVDVLTAAGETFRHVTADIDEHAALLAALGTIVGQNSVAAHAADGAPQVDRFDPALHIAPVAA